MPEAQKTVGELTQEQLERVRQYIEEEGRFVSQLVRAKVAAAA